MNSGRGSSSRRRCATRSREAELRVAAARRSPPRWGRARSGCRDGPSAPRRRSRVGGPARLPRAGSRRPLAKAGAPSRLCGQLQASLQSASSARRDRPPQVLERLALGVVGGVQADVEQQRRAARDPQLGAADRLSLGEPPVKAPPDRAPARHRGRAARSAGRGCPRRAGRRSRRRTPSAGAPSARAGREAEPRRGSLTAVAPVARSDQQVGVAVGPDLAGIEPGRQHRPLQHEALDAGAGEGAGGLGREPVDRQVAHRQQLRKRDRRRSSALISASCRRAGERPLVDVDHRVHVPLAAEVRSTRRRPARPISRPSRGSSAKCWIARAQASGSLGSTQEAARRRR